MVIISAAVCTKTGKILVARQFTNVNKLTLEEYIRNFPKSISANQQHTFVENDFIRYVYLPLETMYVVLVTNKNSNIIEDLETIKLVHKVIVDICSQGISEANIQKNAFEILLGIDDVIAFGVRENITLSQVQAALAMDSSDEKLHMMVLKARINEAKEAAKKAQREMRENKKNPGYKPANAISSESSDSFVKKSEAEIIVNVEKKVSSEKDTKGPVNHAPKKGLQIVKKKDSKAPQAFKKEEAKEILQEEEGTSAKKLEYNPLQAAVLVEFEEKLVCTVQRDGDLSGFEVKGDLFITVRDPTKGNCAIYLEPENNKAIQLKPNPQLNRQFWTEKQAIAPKELKDNFAIGSKINCLKYRYASTNTADLPFNFTYWFNEGSITCELEFNSGQKRFTELSNVSVYFNYPSTESPEVKNLENSDYENNSANALFNWTTTKLSADHPNSNIEIAFSSKVTPEDLFPFAVDFKLPYNYMRVNVKGVAALSDNSSVSFEFVPSLAVERYEIQ